MDKASKFLVAQVRKKNTAAELNRLYGNEAGGQGANWPELLLDKLFCVTAQVVIV